MTKQDYTHLVLVVDRSGSMVTIAEDMNGAISTLLNEQAQLPGKLTVTVCTFDDVPEFVVDFASVTDVPKNLVQPRSMTALNDAIGITVKRTGEALAHLTEDERPSLVVLAIVTDGGENASVEYRDVKEVKAMLDHQKDKYGWQVLFMGTDDIAVQSMAAGYGIPQAQSMSFARTAKGAASYAANLSSVVATARAGGVADFEEVDDEAL